jgi:hypothetical protein
VSNSSCRLGTSPRWRSRTAWRREPRRPAAAHRTPSANTPPASRQRQAAAARNARTIADAEYASEKRRSPGVPIARVSYGRRMGFASGCRPENRNAACALEASACRPGRPTIP